MGSTIAPKSFYGVDIFLGSTFIRLAMFHVFDRNN